MRFTVLISAFFFLIGCKRETSTYPEGGSLGNVEGPYWLNQLTVNGVDSSSMWASSPSVCSMYLFTFENRHRTGQILKSNCVTFANNTWSMSGDKKQVILNFRYTQSAATLYPIALNQDITVAWDIQRLTTRDLWMKTNLNGKEYYLKLFYFN